MTKDEALKLALEALKQIDEAMPFPVAKLAQKVIKEALAQPEQKPVAIYRAGQAKGEVYHVQFLKEMEADEVLLYTTPPQGIYYIPSQRTWVGLTEDEILSISADCASSHQHTDIHFARAIEAKFKEKNI